MMERELKYRDMLLQAINDVATLLLNPMDWDGAMQEALRKLTQSLNVERGRLYRHHASKTNGFATLLHEWVQPQSVSELQHPAIQKFFYHLFSNLASPDSQSMLEALLNNKCVISLWIESEENHSQEKRSP